MVVRRRPGRCRRDPSFRDARLDRRIGPTATGGAFGGPVRGVRHAARRRLHEWSWRVRHQSILEAIHRGHDHVHGGGCTHGSDDGATFRSATMRSALIAFSSGALFAVGLVISGMTQPAKVIGFLDFAGAWDASLAFVMVGALAVHLVAYRIVARRTAPVFANAFEIPTATAVDRRLVWGAAIFGVGWGLAGYCPGPVLVSLGSAMLA